jgi:hypothetical protein
LALGGFDDLGQSVGERLRQRAAQSREEFSRFS